MQFLERLIAQQLGEEIMQRVPRIVMLQSTPPDVAIERVVILRAQPVQRTHRLLLVPAATEREQGPLGVSVTGSALG